MYYESVYFFDSFQGKMRIRKKSYFTLTAVLCFAKREHEQDAFISGSVFRHDCPI